MLKKYKGQEEALLQSIMRKYGVEESRLVTGKTTDVVINSRKKRRGKHAALIVASLIITGTAAVWWYNGMEEVEEVKDAVVSNEEQTIQEGYTRYTEITPADREEILDILRKPVEEDLRSKVKFYVADIKRCDGWIRLKVKPLSPEGVALNNGRAIEALFSKNHSPWQLEEYNDSDEANLLSWSKQYGIGVCIDFLQ